MDEMELIHPSDIIKTREWVMTNIREEIQSRLLLFYEDLSRVGLSSSPASWVCGDLHLENFGIFFFRTNPDPNFSR